VLRGWYFVPKGAEAITIWQPQFVDTLKHGICTYRLSGLSLAKNSPKHLDFPLSWGHDWAKMAILQ
jgi:hypothetical protein